MPRWFRVVFEAREAFYFRDSSGSSHGVELSFARADARPPQVSRIVAYNVYHPGFPELLPTSIAVLKLAVRKIVEEALE